jgi:hypothetical protein
MAETASADKTAGPKKGICMYMCLMDFSLFLDTFISVDTSY